MTLSINTKVAPTTPFQLDGEDYELLTLDHLSPDEEARVIALLSKHTQLGNAITLESDQTRCEQHAKRQRQTRIKVLAMLSTVPKEKLEEIPTGAQVKILNAIESLISDDDDGDESTRGSDDD